MITGKVLLGNGEVFEREFESVKDFIKSDYILSRDTGLSYNFYYNGNKIERLQPREGEDEVEFVKEIKYLKDMIDIINIGILM